jgi:hypothetical protein
MRGGALLLAALALAAAGCGSGGLRGDLSTTAGNIGKIRSGALDFSMLVTPRATHASNPFGFQVDGPFVFGDVPTANVSYTQIANGHRATARLVLDRSGGYAESNGKRRDLTAAELKELRAVAASVRSGSTFDVGSWIESATRCGARCAQGRLDVAAAANSLLGLAGGKQSLTSDEAKQLAGATRAATYRLTWTPAHLVRDLRLHVDLGFAAPPKLQAALGKLVGAILDLHLGLNDPKTS